ncbi:hypothetical protein CPAR01_08991 [Colletotrichum paranaense]|uniref:Uncharacterized protein n=8 Tax=Colletotrichum acutatum species complex TaxID=2707335 RepID=A0A9Q0ATW6_9PEZI|nr:hypothetical protein CABS02_14024 [Colletotrichum abscissum]KAK0370922.1 hypothetical protein CLIM01_11728 [Colletotrichum limetticola]KAK1456936.1 hypothetical protein CCUS01_09815 [Colletotrichum cuscutae]KAK1466767.1 hypothetical protein CMEL01_10760 [Colletotrichum melonis]KAK1509753.1 hypothetical protein CTAM01_01876 [Colletotrichum tamarilloi]KAK1535449.1 hypothetical protein CPAR01_08991 [Colletotrichum paranaense]KAK1536956.1 hypothetical protein CCOS01_02276 [Colletotrichum costa
MRAALSSNQTTEVLYTTHPCCHFGVP